MRVEAEIPTTPEALARALEGWILESRAQFRAHPEWPPFYEWGVVYRREPPGREKWQTAEETKSIGEADCEDGTIARVAELREQGEIDARPEIIRTGSGTLHARVKRGQRGGFRTEDPSRILQARERARKTNTMGDDDDVIPPKAQVELRKVDGGAVATVRWRGENYRVTVEARGADNASATARAGAIAQKVIEHPALKALAPPQALLAIEAATKLAQLAKNKTLQKVAGKLKGPARSLARALLG